MEQSSTSSPTEPLQLSQDSVFQPWRKQIWWAAFLLLLLCQLAPVWMMNHFPTQDGPSHLYNAWVVANLGHDKALSKYFFVRPSAAGNLLVQGFTILAVKILPIDLIDKVTATCLLVVAPLSFVAVATAISSRAKWPALIGFVLFPNWFLQMGFWNYCASIAVFLFSLSFYLRRRHRTWNTWLLLVFSALALLTYAAHVLSWVALFTAVSAAIFVDCLEERSRSSATDVIAMVRRRLLPLLSLLTPVVILVIYGEHSGAALQFPAQSLLKQFVKALTPMFFLVSGRVDVGFLGVFLVLTVIMLGFAINLRLNSTRSLRFGDFLLLAGFLFCLLSFVGPDGINDGLFVRNRFSFYAWTCVMLWLSVQSWSRRATQVIVLCAAVTVVAWSLGRVPVYRQWSRSLDEIASIRSRIIPGSTVFAIDSLYKGDDPGLDKPRVDPLLHAAAEILPTPFIDLGNYEALTDHFLTCFQARYSPEPSLSTRPHLGFDNRNFDVARYEHETPGEVDYLVFVGGTVGKWQETESYKTQLQGFKLAYVSEPTHLVRLYEKLALTR